MESALESYNNRRRIGNIGQTAGYTGAAASAHIDSLRGIAFFGTVGLVGSALSSKSQENQDSIQQEAVDGLNKAYGKYEVVPK